jgi:hypothetical protein
VRFEGAANYLPIVKNGRIDVNIGYGPSTGHIPKFILWDKILNYFTEEILERYWELRLGALSTEHIISELRAFEEAIPETLFEADAKRWEKEREEWWISKGKTGTWDYEPYHYDYMYQWVEERMMYYDAAMLEIENFYYNK